MDNFRKAQQRGSKALEAERERLSHPADGHAMRRLGVFSSPSYVGVGTAEQPSPYDNIGRDRDQVMQEAIKYSIGVPFADLTHTSVHTAPWRGHIPKEGHSQDPQKYFGDITHHLGDGGSLGQRLQTQRMSDFQKDVSKRLSSQPGVPSYVMGFTDVSSFGGAAVSSPSKRR